MTYATILVHLEPGHPNTRLLDIAVDIAVRFDANVIGIAVTQPMQTIYGDYYLSAATVEQDLQEVEAHMQVAEMEFVEAFKQHNRTMTWRSATVFEGPADFIAREARAANLLLTHVQFDASSDSHRLTSTGDLVLKAGRPVLIVSAIAAPLNLDHLLIAWKDTREARRAILDALPLLKKAAHVTVVELAGTSELEAAKRRVDDVSHWLNEQTISAEVMVAHSAGDDAPLLESIAESRGVGVVIAGAYGHSRLREWVFGGVTATLLRPSSWCAFLSH